MCPQIMMLMMTTTNNTDLRRLHEALHDTPQFVNILRGAYFAATKAHAVATASAIAAQPQARAFRAFPSHFLLVGSFVWLG